MATPSLRFLASYSFARAQCPSKCTLLFLAASFAVPFAARIEAQSSAQQYVYGSTPSSANTSNVAAFSKTAPSGALAAVTGSPFNERSEGGLLAIDGLGKFLFVLNPVSNNISMFQINTSTGGLLEVPSSPFVAVPSSIPNQAPSTPIRLATDKSGQFLFVGYRFGNMSGKSAINVFTIDSVRQQITQSQSTDIPSSPVGIATDPKSLHLYVGLGPSSTPGPGTQVYSIDSITGNLTLVELAGGGDGRSIAVDAQGRFFFDGRGAVEGFLDSSLVSPADGTIQLPSTISLGADNFPNALLAESSGKFLYVSESGGTFVYSIDQKTGALTLLPGGPVALTFSTGTAAADPMGPFLYALTTNSIQGFQVDPNTGALTSIASVSTGGQGILGIAISGQSVQASSGPVAVLFPSSLDFTASTVGQPSITRIVSLVNTGNQSLSVNAISLTGVNATDFKATPAASCQPPAILLANANCPISLVFTPSATGLRQASLTVADNAAGSPQSISVIGTGVSATSGVTLIPGTISSLSATQGTTSAPFSVSVKNSGTANLNIFSIVLSGANTSDFILTNNCTGPIAINASCTFSVTFSPLGTGQRNASVIISDDAPNSPQTVELAGMAAPAFTIGAAAGGSLSTTVTAGQTAQFNLQATPGTGFIGTVTLACAGAPMAAACNAPASVQLTGGNSSPFSVMVTTTGAGVVAPFSIPRQPPPFSTPSAFLLAAICFMVLVLCKTRAPHGARPSLRFALPCVLTVTLSLGAIGFAGCGGGSSASTAPPAQPQTPQAITTPSGTFTLTLSLSAANSTGKQLAALAPVQLTLTVK